MKFKIGLLSIILILNYMSIFSGSYIIKFKNGLNKKVNIEKIQGNISNIKPVFSYDNFFLSKKDKTLTDEQKNLLLELSHYYILEDSNIATQLIGNSDIEIIEPNYLYRIEQSIPNDPLVDKQWALEKTHIIKAWDYATGKGIKVGVVDTGIDYYHPDLKNQLWINSKEDINNNGQFDPWSSLEKKNGISGDLNGIDEDANGFTDDVIGFDFVDQGIMNVGDSKDIDPIPNDEHSHGTSVSGVIAAESNNKIGISGIAYNSKVISCRAFDATGNGESDDIANAIVYAVLQGAKVLNFSFGEVYKSSIVYDAVRFAFANGVTMVASSGNNNWDLKHYPSDFEEVISVTACNSENKRSSNGNYGNRLDITAPGTNIYTTLPDTSYGSKGGTSFAAPHVVAAACLLLEKYPELTAPEIKGVLKSSATDVGQFGWDYEYASGILNYAKALETIGSTNITIQYPANEEFIRKENLILPILGTIITPLFKNYQVFIGLGERPKYWNKISTEIDDMVLNDTIYNLDLKNLKDTNYTVRIIINSSNNSSLEKRFYFTLISNNTPLEFVSNRAIQVYNTNYKTISVHSVTNYPSFYYLKYRKKGSNDEYKTLSEYQKFTNFHTVLIEEQIKNPTEYEAISVVYLPNGIKKELKFLFTIEPEIFPENTFKPKNYGFPISHLLNQVADLYNDNKECVVVNDLSAGSWGNFKIYQFNKGDFISKDFLTKKWIPRGIGDSNGDKIPEIFATVFRESALFQQKNQGESPLADVLFIDTMSLNFWAQDMFDIDKDGKDELIAYSDTSFLILKNKGNSYNLLTMADPEKNIGTYPGLARADFDNDGKNEICFGNRYGNIFIYEFDNNKLNLVFTDSSTFSSSEQYITQGDLTNDGIPEIIIGNFGSSLAFGLEEASDPIWTFRILQAEREGVYKAIDTINIFGVRGGTEYSNGVTTGDVDNDNQTELVISTFPNLYVFKWNSEQKNFKPFWNYPYTFSNSAIIHDFDKNGKNEIGFCTFQGTRFYELLKEDSPDIPLGFNAWSIDTNKIYFEWLPVENATDYEVLNMIPVQKGGYQGYTVAVTTSTEALIDTFKNNTTYEFIVRAINKSLPVKESQISNFAEVFTHAPVIPILIEQFEVDKLILTFNGEIAINNINPGFFNLLNNKNEFIQNPISCLQKNDKQIILTFSKKFNSGLHKLILKSFKDKYNSPTIFDTLELNIRTKEEEEFLYLKNIHVLDKITLKLSFSDDVDIESATDILNYQIQPYGSIEEIVEDVLKNEVFIKLSKDPPLVANGKTFSITVNKVKSVSGKTMTSGAGNTLGFVFFAEEINDAYLYPNPVKYNSKPELFFANLPSKAKVVIYNLEFKEINILEETDGNGGVEWDGKDSNGELLNSGVYLFKIIKINSDGTEEESELKKFVILP